MFMNMNMNVEEMPDVTKRKITKMSVSVSDKFLNEDGDIAWNLY